MNREDNKSINEHITDMCCKPEMLGSLTSYTDGKLGRISSRRFERHIRKCSGCARALELTKIAVRTSVGLRKEYLEKAGRISDDTIIEARNRLLTTLRSEPAYLSQTVIPEAKINDRPHFRKAIFSLSAAAAGFIVVTGVILAVSQGNGLFLNKNGELNDYRTSMSSEMAIGNDSTNEEKAAESICETDMSKDAAMDESRQGAETGSGQEYSYDYDLAVAEALNVTEIDAPYNQTMIILLYRKDSIDKYHSIFTDIFEKSGKDAAIEIIGGDNPEKLIEYIGTQLAEDLSAKAVEENADFLVISTGG